MNPQTVEDLGAQLSQAQHLLESLQAVEAAISGFPDRFEAAGEKAVDAAFLARRRLEDRLERLRLPEVRVPFGIERLGEVAERCSRLTDRQWARLQDLARELERKDTEET